MVLPIGIDLLSWAANLLIDFPNDDVPLLYDVDQWREWGDQLVQCETFAQNQAPLTGDYDDWNTWAQAVYYNMNNN
jgi:hypothetical protein